jgi:hypothetical protein
MDSLLEQIARAIREAMKTDVYNPEFVAAKKAFNIICQAPYSEIIELLAELNYEVLRED